MARFDIRLVSLGARSADTSLFLYLTEPGRTIEIAYRLWVLESGSRTIVIDTGPPIDEARRRGISAVSSPEGPLSEIGIDVAKVDTVVLTHLHWDHAANAALFPNATFLAQRREIAFFRSPVRAHPSVDRFFSHHAMITELIDTGRMQGIDGDQTLEPGLDALLAGGHTPGSQMLTVDTPDGLAVLAGDAIPLNRNFEEDIPSGITGNVYEGIEALRRVARLKPRFLYTGHDPRGRLELTG